MGLLYLFRNAWHYAREDRWKVVVFFALHVVSLGGELIQPYAFGRAINSIQRHGLGDLSITFGWLGLYLAGFFVFQAFHHSARYFELITGYRNHLRFVDAMYGAVCGLPMEWHVDNHSGQVMNRISLAGEALRDFSLDQSYFLRHLFLAAGPVAMLGAISPRAAAISLILTGANLLIVQRMNRAIHPVLQSKNETLHAYSARLIDFVSNIRTVIALRLGSRTRDDLGLWFEKHFRENLREMWINQPRCFLIAFGGILTELIIVVSYLWTARVAGEALMIGTLVMVVTYLRQMREAFFEITSNFYEVLHWKAAVESVQPIVEAATRYRRDHEECARVPWRRIAIRGLDHSYRDGHRTLRGIDLDLRPGSTIAVVGMSGCGKSTLLNVLAGLYEPARVHVTIDGATYRDLSVLANGTVLIPQDPELLENTIAYNITFGLPFETERVREAIDAAQLSELIGRLPRGLDTDIREKGVNLSGGEKQRIALARGLLFARDKQMLLLDEVTSNVDAVNERRIFERVLKAFGDRCILCSIHRLHLLPLFERVVVMERGRIAQTGSFEELAECEGRLKWLWERYGACPA